METMIFNFFYGRGLSAMPKYIELFIYTAVPR